MKKENKKKKKITEEKSPYFVYPKMLLLSNYVVYILDLLHHVHQPISQWLMSYGVVLLVANLSIFLDQFDQFPLPKIQVQELNLCSNPYAVDIFLDGTHLSYFKILSLLTPFSVLTQIFQFLFLFQDFRSRNQFGLLYDSFRKKLIFEGEKCHELNGKDIICVRLIMKNHRCHRLRYTHLFSIEMKVTFQSFINGSSFLSFKLL